VHREPSVPTDHNEAGRHAPVASVIESKLEVSPRAWGTATPASTVNKDDRFLIPVTVAESSNAPMTVVLNWQAGLKK
jgi:hypothetical protein